MNDQQQLRLLRQAVRDIERNRRYKAKVAISKIIDDLDPPTPESLKLGPVVKGGKSVLVKQCTHITDALGWPAWDDGFKVGREVIAPEDCVVYDNTSSAQGGDAFYIEGSSGIKYWIAHITVVPAQGRKFKKGQVMTRISGDHPRPHVHVGIDARKLLGRHLESKTNYTYGATPIGKQLAKAA